MRSLRRESAIVSSRAISQSAAAPKLSVICQSFSLACTSVDQARLVDPRGLSEIRFIGGRIRYHPINAAAAVWRSVIELGIA